MGSRNPPLASTGSAFIPSISVDQTSTAATGTANPNNFRQYPPLPPSHSAQQVHPPLPLASATPTPAATTTNTPLNDVTRSPGRMQSGASSRAENLQVSGTPQRKMSYGVGKSNSMRVPRITERRHTLPPRQESIDAVSSAGSNNSNLTRSIKVVCVTAGAKDDLAVKLLRDACEKKKVQFQIIAYNEIAFDEVKATEQFLFADIAFVHLVSKEEESKLFLKIGHRRNYGKNVNVVLYQIPPGNVSEEEQNALSYLKELCVEADTGLLPYYSLPGTSNSSNDMSLDLGHLVLLPPLRTSAGGVESPEWTSLAHELRRVLNSFKQVANKDEALPIVTEMRDLMKTHKGVSLQVELARVYSEKLKQNRSQLTFETVHLFMMALRECQDYASMIDVFRYVRERNYDLSQKEGLIYLYAFALNRRQDAGDREEALSIIETVAEPSADMLCLCGRIYKDLYIESSYQNDRCLENAIQWYKKGAQLEPSDYAMINLATLLVASGKTFESDKDLKRLNNKLSYSIGSQGRLDQIQNYWVVATYFELCVLLDDKQQAVDAARRMFHLNAPAWYIKSTLHNLKLILSKRQEVAKGLVSPYSNSSESSFSSRHQHKQQQLLTLPGHSFEDSVSRLHSIVEPV
ncbi:mitogen-activated protein kinase kinase kinase 15-like [Convolutriloba macropyga]|uniref:mitogen-activated protein kinase kinase kinase 15-like n=1 Tax=Convolutriloba macropyga TaxID=536237 RepID=UPI003F51FDEC